jgi:hypothetical protein
VHFADAWNASNYPLGLRIEHDHSAVAEMRDEEQVTAFIETLIVQPCGVSAQRNIRYPNER